MIKRIKEIFRNRNIYLLWTLISSLLYLITYNIEPYVFGFFILGAIWESIGLVLLALIINWRVVHWAVLAALPTLCALWVVQEINWA